MIAKVQGHGQKEISPSEVLEAMGKAFIGQMVNANLDIAMLEILDTANQNVQGPQASQISNNNNVVWDATLKTHLE